jgi:hypothetical protein
MFGTWTQDTACYYAMMPVLSGLQNVTQIL